MLETTTATAFTAWGAPVSWLEVAAFAASLAMVLANLRVHPVAWPLAIFSSAAYGLLFAQSKLYGEAGLQVVFIALALWGWWQWLRGMAADGSARQVSHLQPRQQLGAIGEAAHRIALVPKVGGQHAA